MSDLAAQSLLAGHSALAQLMREHDWSASPLGPPEHWPPALRSVVSLMLGSAFPMFIGWGPALHTLYNDAYAQMMGAKHPAGLGRPFLEIWSEIGDDLRPLVRRAMGGEAFYMENLPLRMRRHGYEEDTWFTFSWSPVLDEAGSVAGMYCACTETTRMVLAERHLRAREEWLQTLFDQSPGFAAVLRGPDHVFEMANQAYLAITGQRPLIGRAFAQALPELVGQGFLDWLDEVFGSGVPYVGRSVPVTVNQQAGCQPYEAFVDFMYQPLRNANGEVEGIFVQGHDVTEQHRAQQALRAADRQKDEFLATLAHELRNPLAPIRTATHLLSSPEATPSARSRATEIIARQVGHMSRLLDDLIDIARITQGRLLLRKERVDVAAIVDAALEAARPLAEAKGHALTVTLPTQEAALMADPVRIAQVLSNLLNNASKYTDPGGRIVLDVQAEEEVLRFVITDNGIGLSESALENLFVMFAQEKAALERSEGGLGIGLALVKALVELHGGQVSASSDGPGKGSRFEVALPRANAMAPPVRPSELAETAATGTSARHWTVLLADDNRDACEVLAEVLRMDGHAVHLAHDGQEAARLALQHRPEVMVLDIGMPGLNGYEVAQQVRAQPWGGQPFLIAATGWGQEADRHKALQAGFDCHLTKPFEPRLISDLIHRRTTAPLVGDPLQPVGQDDR
jgi:signal transduction histidine kinase/CheY-like chemotaxis protein